MLVVPCILSYCHTVIPSAAQIGIRSSCADGSVMYVTRYCSCMVQLGGYAEPLDFRLSLSFPLMLIDRTRGYTPGRRPAPTQSFAHQTDGLPLPPLDSQGIPAQGIGHGRCDQRSTECRWIRTGLLHDRRQSLRSYGDASESTDARSV